MEAVGRADLFYWEDSEICGLDLIVFVEEFCADPSHVEVHEAGVQEAEEVEVA